ncbi:MAG TPA: hypothetical protein VME86_02355 [Acidobacteriaceae bacterium]|nr:hypothetical protein [Acidobacteriaceae bacterium]
MQSQNTSGLVELLKENMALRAENEALADILKVSDLTGERPVDWRAILKDARQSKAYRDMVERYDPVFSQLDDAVSRAEIDMLLQSIPLREPVV